MVSLYKTSGRKKRYTKMIGIILLFAILIGLFIVLNHNQNTIYSINIEGTFLVTIIATENFGTSILFDEEIIIESGESAMDVLHKVATVTTTYGGGYVGSINGIKSQYTSENGKKKDWLYYINGMLASVGANQYKPHPGDVIHWDFHDWSSDRAVTAIIGDYPEPFLHGYNGKVTLTSIVYAEEFYESAFELQQSLEDYGISISMKHFEELTENEKRSHNLIFIDTYENDLISELNENADQLGWFIEHDKSHIITFDETGTEDRTLDHGGVMLTTQNTWNPKGNWHCENVVWVITGITDEDVTTAVELLITNHEDIKHCVSLIIVKGTVYKVP
jgi:hypothetical protein